MGDNSSKRSSYKVAGAVVATILVLLAVIVSFLGSIKITKKSTATSSKTVQTEVSQNSDTSVSTNKSTSKEESDSKVENSISDGDILMKLIRNEGKLDYSGSIFTTSGVVSSKSCYLQGNQVIYEFCISIGVGVENLVIKYYCPYDTYISVDVDDMVTVNYKQVSESAFAVTSVTK